MSYNPNVPQPTDLLSNSQGQILANFNKANSSFGINHYPFDNGTANNGKHKFVTIPQAIAPFNPPASVLNEIILYAKAGSAGTELRMVRDGFPTTDTNLTLAAGLLTAPKSSSNGYSWLPGGMVLQWGTVTNPGTSGSVLFVTNNVDFPNSCFLVIPALQHNSSANESVTIQPTPSITGFSYRTTSSSGNTVLYWWAIGN